MDDALHETHIPKVDDWEQYLYIAMHAISYMSGEDDIDAIELDIFLGENYIVTHHDLPIQALNRVWDVCTKDARHFKRGADHVLYKLTDELIVDYMQVVEALDEEIERVEDAGDWQAIHRGGSADIYPQTCHPPLTPGAIPIAGGIE